MRRLICAAVLGMLLSTNVGCFTPIFSGDQSRRAKQLLFVSEDQRTILDELDRFWHLDQPSHMKPYRTHGGIIQ